MTFKLDRRKFLFGTTSLFCAPAIIKAENLMKMWIPPKDIILWINPNRDSPLLKLSSPSFFRVENIINNSIIGTYVDSSNVPIMYPAEGMLLHTTWNRLDHINNSSEYHIGELIEVANP